MIKTIHKVKGRVRYKIRELYRSTFLKTYLEETLTMQPEIRSVSANILTSNVLIIFKERKIYPKIDLLLEQTVSDYKQNYYQSLLKADAITKRQKQEKFKTKTLAIADVKAPKIENWHLQEASSVLDVLNTSQTSGLSSELAVENLSKYGPNLLCETETRSDLSILIDQFKSLPVALLGIAAGVSIVTGGLIDALVIVGVIGLNATIGYTTESQSERIIHSLKSREQTSTLAIRDGIKREIPTQEVVVGDLLVLKVGDYVAADARLIEAENLSVDESALTGESIPVTKTTKSIDEEDVPLADRTNMVYKGTLVVGGQGIAVVVGTGKYTEMGKIQQLVGEADATETPLARQLDEVGSQLVALSIVICGGVFGIGLLRGYGLLQMLQSSISLAVAAVPEGLPTIATTTLALGIQDMRKHKVLVRSLSAVEALGSVQTICMDKTGTITENRMSVVEIQADSRYIQMSDGEFIAGEEKINPYLYPELLRLIHVSVLCNESEVRLHKDGEYAVTGSATENALIYMGISAGVNVIELREKYFLLQTNPRSETRNRMSTVHRDRDGHLFVALKGSPAEVVRICTGCLKNGQVVPLTDEDRQDLELENDRMAGKALRVLGIAYCHIEDNENDCESNLTWLGLVGMADPIRKGVKALMGDFHEAGIDTVMITGDQSPTAYAIAKELKLTAREQLEILDSSNLNNLSPEALTALCDKVDVFARISPSNKLQIVQALQGAGKVVAMTGDGINDAPALKAAQVGVAMGKGGTDVAREVADIILEDDRLETMIIAVSRGRTIYNNIRKSVHFLLATNLSEIMVMTTATAVGLGEPLNAIQLLWLNLVTDIFPGLSLALEPPEPDVLSQPPRNPNDPIVKNSDFGRIVFESGLLTVGTLAAYGYGISKYGIGPQASTMAFLSLTSAQLLHTIGCRSEVHSIFSREKLPNNPYLTAAIVGSFGVQFLAIAIPQLRSILKIAPIDLIDGAVIGSSALLPLLINESTKRDRAFESDKDKE
ncbi:MAG: cation-translocating P-type ATPase [Hydrococcus sp. Prado102]|nr:cation-translocating P-type ATPase [Hydrococcus sp. Prado102]